jgi:hypothetical protein
MMRSPRPTRLSVWWSRASPSRRMWRARLVDRCAPCAGTRGAMRRAGWRRSAEKRVLREASGGRELPAWLGTVTDQLAAGTLNRREKPWTHVRGFRGAGQRRCAPTPLWAMHRYCVRPEPSSGAFEVKELQITRAHTNHCWSESSAAVGKRPLGVSLSTIPGSTCDNCVFSSCSDNPVFCAKVEIMSGPSAVPSCEGVTG